MSNPRYEAAKGKWKEGFRWCDNCDCRCESLKCLEDDVCGQVASGDTSGSAASASKAYYLNKSLRKAAQ